MIYKTELGGTIDVKFNVGDIVKITNVGRSYEYYSDAFKYFGILDLAKPVNIGIRRFEYCLKFDYDLNTNYVILGIGLHVNETTILYHIVNTKRQHMVIDGLGLELKRRANKENNDELTIFKIPSYIEL